MREKRVRECHAANDPAGTRCSGHLPSCDMCPNLLNSAVRSHQPNVSVSAFHVLLSPLSDTQTCISLWLNSNTNITLLERKMLTYDCWTEQNHYSYQHWLIFGKKIRILKRLFILITHTTLNISLCGKFKYFLSKVATKALSLPLPIHLELGYRFASYTS